MMCFVVVSRFLADVLGGEPVGELHLLRCLFLDVLGLCVLRFSQTMTCPQPESEML